MNILKCQFTFYKLQTELQITKFLDKDKRWN